MVVAPYILLLAGDVPRRQKKARSMRPLLLGHLWQAAAAIPKGPCLKQNISMPGICILHGIPGFCYNFKGPLLKYLTLQRTCLAGRKTAKPHQSYPTKINPYCRFMARVTYLAAVASEQMSPGPPSKTCLPCAQGARIRNPGTSTWCHGQGALRVSALGVREAHAIDIDVSLSSHAAV